MALGRRQEVSVPPLVKMLESPALNSRYGACQALIALRERGAPAIEALRKALADQDLWLRIKAAEAIAAIGAPAMQTAPQLLEIKPLLPAIYQAIIEPAPSGEMFADSIRVEGLRLLAKHRIAEGINACVQYTRDQNPWASEHRTPELMKVLLSYGTHAKSVIPELTQIANYFEKDEKDFPQELMLKKAKSVRETMVAIEASTDTPELSRLQ